MNKNATVRHHLLECILWPQEQTPEQKQLKLQKMYIRRNAYLQYKENGGKLKWNDFQKEFYG